MFVWAPANTLANYIFSACLNNCISGSLGTAHSWDRMHESKPPKCNSFIISCHWVPSSALSHNMFVIWRRAWWGRGGEYFKVKKMGIHTHTCRGWLHPNTGSLGMFNSLVPYCFIVCWHSQTTKHVPRLPAVIQPWPLLQSLMVRWTTQFD